MTGENKDCVLQIKVTRSERMFIENFLLRRSFLDGKRYSISSFLSESLMEKLNQDYHRLLIEETNVNKAKG